MSTYPFKCPTCGYTITVRHGDTMAQCPRCKGQFPLTPPTWWESKVSTRGTKHDEQKLRFDLLPPDAEEILAAIFTMGAGKYGDRNWEEGIEYGRLYAAARRHLSQFWKGEDLDEESGLPHVAHAAWNCLALLQFHLCGYTHLDDRSKMNGRMKELRFVEKGTISPTEPPL